MDPIEGARPFNDMVQDIDRDTQSNGTSLYKVFMTKGFKRALFLILLITLLNVIYVIFYKLNEDSVSTVFQTLMTKMKAPKNFIVKPEAESENISE